MAALPPELMEDILLRMPVKSLLRFRSISKPWCALIDTPDFIKNHLNRSISTKSNRSLYLVSGSSVTSLDLTSPHTSIGHEFQLDDLFLHCVIGSCNGLFLLLLTGSEIALFNPATRRYRIIATPSPTVDVRYGLGYDSVNDDYKVIEFFQEFKGLGSCNEVVKIYSLKLNSWRKVEGKFPWDIDCHLVLGAHVNGCLHKIVVSRTDSDEKSRKIIVAFDLVTEKSHLIPLPDDFPVQCDIQKEDVLEGYLCVLATNQLYTDMWIMRDYGVNSSWLKFLSIGPPHMSCYHSLCPLALSKNGEEVLLHIDYKELIWYDLERRSVMKDWFRGLPLMFQSKVSVDSLISLDGSCKRVGIEKEVKEEESTRDNNHDQRDDSSRGFGN